MDDENNETEDTLHYHTYSDLLPTASYDSDDSSDSRYSDYASFSNEDFPKKKKLKVDKSQFFHYAVDKETNSSTPIDHGMTDDEEFEQNSNATSFLPHTLSTGCDYELTNSVVNENNLQTETTTELSQANSLLHEKLTVAINDKSLVYCGPPLQFNSELIGQKKESIKAKVAIFLQELLLCFSEGNSKSCEIFQCKWSNCAMENNILLPRSPVIRMTIQLHLAKNSIMVDVLNKISSMIADNSICTLREIYYQLKPYQCVKDQSQIARCMSRISNILNVEPWYFPITSTSKGLFFGNLTMIDSSGEVVSYRNQKEMLIPENILEIREFKSDASFIILVEKDAIFKKLVDEELANKLTMPFIMITGKGYPDIKTRLFTKRLYMSLKIPIFALVDGDPYGIDIMLTYRFGSLNCALWNQDMAIPNLRWLGILPSEMNSLNIAHENLSEKDKRKINAMLTRPYIEENPWLKKELEIMLRNDIKTEIEGVIKSRNNLTNFYLIAKFYARDYF